MSRSQTAKNSQETSHNETTPLLNRPEDRPLPMGQMYLLCFARMVEPCKPGTRASPLEALQYLIPARLGLHRGLLFDLPVYKSDGERNRRAGKPDRLLYRLDRKLLLLGSVLHYAILGKNERHCEYTIDYRE